MRLPKLLVAMSTLVASGSIAFAAEPPKPPPPASLQELDQKLEKVFKDANVPGASIAIIEDGKVVLARGYGVSDVSAKTPVTPDTVFRAGSISKSIVGIAVMMLVEEGKLDLNAKLSDLAPEIHFQNKWEATDPVRLVHLMEHTTGFDDIRFRHYLLQGDVPLKQAVDMYGPYVSRWRPGTYVSYSNAPPVIAGYIVEKASGMSWDEFTRKRIFEPLGMTSAHWTLDPSIAGRISKSYSGDGVTEQPYVNIVGKPAGALDVTPSDLAKLAMMLMNRGSYNGKQLLKPESVARIETPGSTLASRLGLHDGYGFGNVALMREKAIFHGHDGGIDGFLSTYFYEPEHHVGAVMMVNAQQGKAFEAVDLVAGYFQRNWPDAPPPAEMKPTQAELDALTGIYQTVTPRQQMLAPVFYLLDWTPISSANGGIVLNEMTRKQVGPRLFRRPDRTAANIVFGETEDGTVMLAATDASRRVPMWEIAAKAGYGVALGLAVALTVLFMIVWVPSSFLGRVRERGGVLVRLVPLLTVVAMAAFGGAIFMVLVSSSLGDPAVVGTPSLFAQSIYYLSFAYPVLGVLAVLIGLSSGSASAFVRGLAIVDGVLALIAAVYLWPYGWVGLQIWA